MKKVIIRNLSNEVLQFAKFENDFAMVSWLEILSSQHPFGKPERWVKEGEEDVTGALETRIAVEGELSHTEYKLPSQYLVEIKDITQEVEAERVKHETKKADRVSRVDQLKAIDWTAIDTLTKLKIIVKLLAKEAIKDDE